MPEYRRFISYFYEYIDGKKQKNTGFAKVELRNGIWRILFRLTVDVPPRQPVEVFGFIREGGKLQGFPMGTMRARREMTEEWAYRADKPVWRNKYGLSDIAGIWIRSGEGRCFASVWDDEPVDSMKFTKAEENVPELEQAKERRQKAELQEATEGKKTQKAEPQEVTEGKKTQGLGSREETEREKSQRMELQKGIETQEMWLQKGIETQESGLQKEKEEKKVQEAEPQNEAEGKKKEKLQRMELQKGIETQESGAWEETEGKKAQGMGSQEETERKKLQRMELQKGIETQESGLQKEKEEKKVQEAEPQNKVGGKKTQESEPQKCEEEQNKPSGISVMDLGKTDNGSRGKNRDDGFWNDLFGKRIKIQPFSDREISGCIRVDPGDIVMLQNAHWCTGRNNFLLHGYHNYRHLLIGKRADGEYVLGVPGTMNPQEKYMASMFGFPDFKYADGVEVEPSFGYWFRPLRRDTLQ